MNEVIKYVNSHGEVFYGLILQWYGNDRELCEVFFDKIRHPILKELKVVNQCTIPHEPNPEIGWFNVKKYHEDAQVRILPARFAAVHWECRDIAALQGLQDLADGLSHMDLTPYRTVNRAKSTP